MINKGDWEVRPSQPARTPLFRRYLTQTKFTHVYLYADQYRHCIQYPKSNSFGLLYATVVIQTQVFNNTPGPVVKTTYQMHTIIHNIDEKIYTYRYIYIIHETYIRIYLFIKIISSAKGHTKYTIKVYFPTSFIFLKL